MAYNPHTALKAFQRFESPDRLELFFDNGAGGLLLKDSIQAQDYYQRMFGTVTPWGPSEPGESASRAKDQAREILGTFLNAHTQSLCYKPSATDSFQYLAYLMGLKDGFLTDQDSVLTTELDHQSNVYYWQELAIRKQAEFLTVRMTDEGRLDMDHLEHLVKKYRPKLVTFTLASNVLGSIPDRHEIIKLVRNYREDAIIVGDAVHYAPHMPLDIQDDFDALVVSMYKVFSPSASLLAMKPETLRMLNPPRMPQIHQHPMHLAVEHGGQAWANYYGASQTVSWIKSLTPGITSRECVVNGMNAIHDNEMSIFKHLLNRLQSLDYVQIFGPSSTQDRVPTIAFRLHNTNSNNVEHFLNQNRITVRAHHFYALGVAKQFNLLDEDYQPKDGGFIRASLAPFHTEEHVNTLVDAIEGFWRQTNP